MSSPEQRKREIARGTEKRGRARRAGVCLAGLAAALLALPACTVQPLYSQAGMTGTVPTTAAAGLPGINIQPVISRDAQQVRNQLIFLLNGGAGQPAKPRYTLILNVLTLAQSTATVQIASDEEPTAAAVLMTSTYLLTDNQTGKPVAQGRREIQSSYDVPRQEYAVLRARIDAENRAARELAELLKLAIIQSLKKLPQTPEDAVASSGTSGGAQTTAAQ